MNFANLKKNGAPLRGKGHRSGARKPPLKTTANKLTRRAVVFSYATNEVLRICYGTWERVQSVLLSSGNTGHPSDLLRYFPLKGRKPPETLRSLGSC